MTFYFMFCVRLNFAHCLLNTLPSINQPLMKHRVHLSECPFGAGEFAFARGRRFCRLHLSKLVFAFATFETSFWKVTHRLDQRTRGSLEKFSKSYWENLDTQKAS